MGLKTNSDGIIYESNIEIIAPLYRKTDTEFHKYYKFTG